MICLVRNCPLKMTPDPLTAGCRAPLSSNAPSVEIAGSIPPTDSEKRARAWITSSSVATSTVRRRSSGRPAERIGQREQNAANLLGLLLLERDDVVVDLDGAERLEKQAGAAGGCAVDDAGDRGAMFGAHDEHVAAVAIGDDLILQVLRRCRGRAEIRRASTAASRAACAAGRGSPPAPATRRRRRRRPDRSSAGRRRSRL